MACVVAAAEATIDRVRKDGRRIAYPGRLTCGVAGSGEHACLRPRRELPNHPDKKQVLRNVGPGILLVPVLLKCWQWRAGRRGEYLRASAGRHRSAYVLRWIGWAEAPESICLPAAVRETRRLSPSRHRRAFLRVANSMRLVNAGSPRCRARLSSILLPAR
jgi:hypothetical protein